MFKLLNPSFQNLESIFTRHLCCGSNSCSSSSYILNTNLFVLKDHQVIQGLCRTLAVCLSIIVVIGGSFPPFLISVIPLGWFYIRVMRCNSNKLPCHYMLTYDARYYLATSRELKRMDAVSRSPIFAWFSQSLAGLSTIRAFNQQSAFIAVNQQFIDHNQICYLPSISVNRWLAVRLEFIGATIILIVALLAMGALITTGVDAGLVGLVLSYALNATSSLVSP